jgi:hypothetical protein
MSVVIKAHRAEEYKESLAQYIELYFKPLIDREICALLIDREFQIEIATNQSKKILGIEDWQQFKQISSENFCTEEYMKLLFKDQYKRENHEEFVFYCEKIRYLQQLVFSHGKVIQFIDMLPYNGKFVIHLTNYAPIIDGSGEVIAINSTSVESYVLRFQGHLRKPNIKVEDKEFKKQFSSRELEILFLLTNGATQEQIAQILNLARTTIATIIANQICPKFSITGANTKMLMDAAINAGFYLDMPKSLWKPCIIILNEDLLEDPHLKEIADKN